MNAARSRQRIPAWAMPVLIGLPLWAYVYVGTLEPPPAPESDPLVLGEAVYASCAACHGASGEGVGSTPGLAGVLETWPDARDHLLWVRVGAAGWPGDSYGANAKPKGVGMPSHASFSDAELAQVVLYERVTFGGLEPGSDEYLLLVEVAEGRRTIAELGPGALSSAVGLAP